MGTNKQATRLAGLLLLALAGLLGASVTPGAAPMHWQERTLTLPGGDVLVRDTGGSGVAIVMLHAGSGNSRLWAEYQLPAYSAAGYRVIAVDYRGVAETGNTRPVVHLEEAIAAMRLGRFHLVGTAAGGGVALEYALANAGQLRSLVVANSLGNVQDAQYAALGKRLRPPAFDALPLELRELGPSYRAAQPEGVERWLALSRGDGAGPAPRPAAAPGMTPPPAPSADNDPHVVTWARLGSLKLPVLLLTGDADLYTPPSVLREFAARIPGAKSAIVPDSGHSAFWENPTVFNRSVLAFLRRH